MSVSTEVFASRACASNARSFWRMASERLPVGDHVGQAVDPLKGLREAALTGGEFLGRMLGVGSEFFGHTLAHVGHRGGRGDHGAEGGGEDALTDHGLAHGKPVLADAALVIVAAAQQSREQVRVRAIRRRAPLGWPASSRVLCARTAARRPCTSSQRAGR